MPALKRDGRYGALLTRRAAIKKKAYLSELEKCGAITVAAQRVPVSYKVVMGWRAEDPEFADQEFAALERLADRLEALTVAVAEDRKDPASTTNRIFWLKAQRPQRFRDRVEHTGPGGGPIKVDLL